MYVLSRYPVRYGRVMVSDNYIRFLSRSYSSSNIPDFVFNVLKNMFSSCFPYNEVAMSASARKVGARKSLKIHIYAPMAAKKSKFPKTVLMWLRDEYTQPENQVASSCGITPAYRTGYREKSTIRNFHLEPASYQDQYNY